MLAVGKSYAATGKMKSVTRTPSDFLDLLPESGKTSTLKKTR
jgi:hypothetical protein